VDIGDIIITIIGTMDMVGVVAVIMV
jgi:hypothetical protein